MPAASRRRRYPSDTSVAEWALLEALLPVPACQTKTGGHPEKWPRREIVDGIRYIVDNGAKWRALPADFPPWETVYGFFRRWNRTGVVTYIRDQLRRRIRTGKGRCPHPVTLIVDSQSVKGASTVGRNSRGYDAAKKINGRKRQCVPACANIARTDQHASGLRLRATALEQQAGHVPGPLGERLRDNAARLRDLADTHHRTRISLQDGTA